MAIHPWPRGASPTAFLFHGNSKSPFLQEFEYWHTRCPSWLPGGEGGCNHFSCGSKTHGLCNKIHPSRLKAARALQVPVAPAHKRPRAHTPRLPLLPPALVARPAGWVEPQEPQKPVTPLSCLPRKPFEFEELFKSPVPKHNLGPPPLLKRPGLGVDGAPSPSIRDLGGLDHIAGLD
eukprot:CAMPEP_0171101354 /NCGR_PEP_ID=MMETSP0766_2-20121228/54761_1 /TAXON_ID=439317 /ORGANISM="Gambierdiscus australes, Strain CAWD 149" /LENGTH=176 /DNA_ID=CAMNT_0011561383 /DNA_START=60 /DNA_END=590 /DNA_ORIENTATION=+